MPTPTPLSKLARVVALAALVAAMNLAGMTTGAQAHTSKDPAHRRLLAQERYYGTWGYEDPTADAQQLFRRGERASMDHPTTPTPAAVTTPVRPAEPRHQPGLLPVSLGVLAAALAMVAVVALLVGRRAHRTQRAGRTA